MNTTDLKLEKDVVCTEEEKRIRNGERTGALRDRKQRDNVQGKKQLLIVDKEL